MKKYLESYNEFLKAKESNTKTKTKCIICNSNFSKENTFTSTGWKETQISGCCEVCFDDMFGNEQ